MEARWPELRNRAGGAPGTGSSAVRPGSPGSRCFMGISFSLVLVDGLPPPGWATWVNRVPSVERGGGENGWADGLTAGALRAGPEPPTKNIRSAAPRAGLGRFHCRVRELLWSRRPLSRTCTGRTLNGLGAQTHRQCSWRRRCCCSCHRSRCDCNGRQESPTAAAVELPPSRSPRRRSGAVDGNRATAAPARDSRNPASIHRLRFVMDEGPPAADLSPLAGRSLWRPGGPCGGRAVPAAAGRSLWRPGGPCGGREVPVAAGRSLWRLGGPCDGCEAPVSGFRRPRRSPVFLPVCRHRGMSGLRPWAALTGEVRYRIDAFGGRCPGRRVSQTVPPH